MNKLLLILVLPLLVFATKYGQIKIWDGTTSVDVDSATNSLQVSIQDPLEVNGGIPVNIQDQTTEIIDLYMHRNLGTITLAQNTVIDQDTIILVAGHSVDTGDIICFKTSTRYTQAKAISINADTIRLDIPLDYAYQTTDSLHRGEHDMSVDGSTTPVYFHINPPSNLTWDVVRVMFHIEDATTMDDGTFGGLAALTKGVVLRVSDGIKKNIFNVKTNGEFAERAYDREYVSKPPSGTGNSMNVRRTFGGQSKNGVVIRLNGSTSDELQIIIQDNLTGLNHFHCIVQGHVTQD